jgi:hypothetical protein
MARQTKTRKVHVRADGYRYVLHFERGFWMWDIGRGSFPQSAAIDNIIAEGGHVEIEPNPNYREPSPFEVLGRLLYGK